MAHTQEMTTKQKILNSFSAFLQKNRILLIVIFAVILAFVIGFAIYTEVSKNISENSALQAENLQSEYQSWKGETDTTKKSELEKKLNALMEETLKKHPNSYGAQRALFISGEMAFEQKFFDKAAESFKKLGESFPRSYLAPVALFNAAVAYEEGGNADEAIAQYAKLVEKFEKTAPQIPHALFSLGRLYEEKNDFAKASEWYDKLIDNFSASSWTNLAKDRIIYLKVNDKISK